VEHACGMGTLQMGEYVSNVSNGIDTFSIREPLGVCAGICPFNFPAMIPLWMFPIAVTCGNTVVLKPSEKDPGAAMMLAELAMEAGLPKGVLNIVHGTHVWYSKLPFQILSWYYVMITCFPVVMYFWCCSRTLDNWCLLGAMLPYLLCRIVRSLLCFSLCRKENS
jgi:hypothetical protein